MSSAPPSPKLANGITETDWGLICGYQLVPGQKPTEIFVDGIEESLARRDAVTWLHLNLGDARTRRWIGEAAFLPDHLRELLNEHNDDRRIEAADDGLLVVMSDFAFEDESDPWEVATLWCFARPRMLISARIHPVRSADALRLELRGGFTTGSGTGLLAQLLELRTGRLRRLSSGMTVQLDTIEDEILAGNIKQQREQLGRMRRLCARLRRQFVPEKSDMSKFLRRSPAFLDQEDRDPLVSADEGLGYAVEEIAEHYERAKLLQEELASRLAENTGRNLYVLSILTAVLLPMTLVTGIFGMNVAGLPGLHSHAAFWQVMLLIFASGGATLAALFWRRLL
jgi:zinc transporter